MSRISFARVTAASILVVLVGCGTSGSKLAVTEITASPDAAGIQRIEVELHSYYFKPSRIVVESGKPVEMTLKFKNLFTPHNLTCDHKDAGIQIDKGAGFMSFHRTKRSTFTPTKPGEYSFYCGVGSHMMKGMKGTLVVR